MADQTDTFEAEIAGYYEAKKPYLKLLDEALHAKAETMNTPMHLDPPVNKCENQSNAIFDPSIFGDLPGDSDDPDLKEVAKKMREIRLESEKGQSKIKKSDWERIERVLGR
jgi:hypothetical protein